MANIFEERLAEAKQKRDMARLLRQQYDNQPSGQMVSGWYVPNTGNAILGALANVIGGYQESEANKEAKGIERERSQALAQALGSAGIAPPQTLLQQAGTPEEKPGFLDRTVSFLRGEQTPTKPAIPYQVNVAQNVTPNQYNQALTNMMSISPEYASNILALEKMKAEQAKEARQERMAKVPVGWQLGPNGELVSMPVAGGTNFADFELKKAAAKEGIISPVERQNMAVQLANLGISEKNLERNIQKDTQEQARLQEGKDIPANQLSSQAENFNAINQIDKAIQAVDSNPNAFGAQNYLPGAVTQRLDPKGVDARARVAEIGAVKLHDLSGATVNASEAPRFQPFLPSATDDPQKIKENLLKMRESMIGLEQERNNMYSDGWKKQLKPLDRFKQPEQPAQGGFTIRPLGQ